MPKSKSKPTARVASSAAMRKHPALNNPHPAIHGRLHQTEDGYRLPDEYLEPTAVTVLNDNYTISSNNIGTCLWLETQYGNRIRFDDSNVTNIETSNTVTRQLPALQAVALRARVVSVKIKITYIGAALSAAGYMSYVRRHTVNIAGNTNTDSFHQLADAQVPAPAGFHVTGTPYQECEFEDLNVNPTSWMTKCHHTHLFVASGLPVSTPCFRVQVQRFVEYIPKEGDLGEGALKTEPHDPGAHSVLHTLSALKASVSSMVGHTGHVKQLMQFASQAYHMVQPIMPYLAGTARTAIADYLTPGMLMLGM